MAEIIFHRPQSGVFQLRKNRFIAAVESRGGLEEVYLPSTGRMEELLVQGAEVLLEPVSSKSKRRTSHDLVAVLYQGHWVGIDSRQPNRLVAEALKGNELAFLRGYNLEQEEPSYSGGRFDFLLQHKGQKLYLEVKSVTLVSEGVALFPDAPTRRGSRHVRELEQLTLGASKALLLFVIQREDADCFSPHALQDPEFAERVRSAHGSGVELRAIKCRVTERGISLDQEVPVRL